MWYSDSLVDAKTTDQLKSYAVVLEAVPDRLKDWHPSVRSRMLNLIDPSLYPLDYRNSKLCRRPDMVPEELRKHYSGEFPGSLKKWHDYLKWSRYYVPTIEKRNAEYTSDRFSWLPSEFCVDNTGAVTIESYINNLHPVKLSSIFQTMIVMAAILTI
ncbi:hypothetical protein GGI21_005616, partial [Coemansia aciculifera]